MLNNIDFICDFCDYRFYRDSRFDVILIYAYMRIYIYINIYLYIDLRIKNN